MVVRSESREQVAGGVEEVYGYLAEVERLPEWASAIVECRVGAAPRWRPGPASSSA